MDLVISSLILSCYFIFFIFFHFWILSFFFSLSLSFSTNLIFYLYFLSLLFFLFIFFLNFFFLFCATSLMTCFISLQVVKHLMKLFCLWTTLIKCHDRLFFLYFSHDFFFLQVLKHIMTLFYFLFFSIDPLQIPW